MMVQKSAALIACLGASLAGANEPDLDRFQLHGFASQAMVRTSANKLYGDSPDTSLDFTEVGVNGSWLPLSRLSLSGQVLYRNAGELADNQVSLDYLFADLGIEQPEQNALGLRLGRTKNPLGLYNATRDVPFTRPSIFLPHVVYFDKVRNLLLSSDGAQLYGEWYSDYGQFEILVSGGVPPIDGNVEWTFLSGDFPGRMESDGINWLGRLWYTSADQRVALGLSGIQAQLSYDAAPSGPLEDGRTNLTYWIASAQYDAERWSLTAEYMREPVQWRDYGPFFPRLNLTTEGWYIQGVYRPRQDMELLVRWEDGYADRTDKDGSAGFGVSEGLVPAHLNYSKIFTLGARWDVTSHLMVRAEYQRHQGTFILSHRDNPDNWAREEYWDLFALQIAVRF